MMHDRRWCISQAESTEQLAQDLTQRRWTLCTGFQLASYYFLNDATSEDAAQEYAVVKVVGANAYLQVESITMSWCSIQEAAAFIRKALAGEMDGYDFARPVHPRLETPEEHRHCHLCA